MSVTKEDIEAIAHSEEHEVSKLLLLKQTCLKLLTERDQAVKEKEAYRTVAINTSSLWRQMGKSLGAIDFNENEIVEEVDTAARRLLEEGK